MSHSESSSGTERTFFHKKLRLSMLIPGIFVFLMWLVKVCEILFEMDLTRLGIFPFEVRGLAGIMFSPFIHSDFRHLFNNTLPLFFLWTALFYFYSEIAVKVSLWTWLLTGLSVWLAGRPAWHIGASGLIYGFASFLFFSGIIRKYFRLVALSLLIVFLYGSMVWGIFPDIYQGVSWESHMLGFISGIILSIVYRKEGPQEPLIEWPDEEEEGEGGGERPPGETEISGSRGV